MPVFVITDLDALIDGFDKLGPSAEAERLRSDLPQKIDTAIGKDEGMACPKAKAIERAA